MPALTPSQSSQQDGIVASVTVSTSLAIAWIPPRQIDRGAWVAAGRRIGEYGRVSNWWVGDWINYGNARWGEKYAEAARITGFDPKTLRNIASVVSRFDLSRRRDNLDFTHHAEVAALDRDQQDEWLDRAVALKLSTVDLRQALKADQRGLKSAQDSGECKAGNETENVVVCPQCGYKLAAVGSIAIDGPR